MQKRKKPRGDPAQKERQLKLAKMKRRAKNKVARAARKVNR